MNYSDGIIVSKFFPFKEISVGKYTLLHTSDSGFKTFPGVFCEGAVSNYSSFPIHPT
jgi:hypothetical protein